MDFEDVLILTELLNIYPTAETLAWRHAKDISASIHARLRELSMNQRDFARELGVSPGYVSQLIKGSPGMTLKTLAKVETVLDFNLGAGFTYVVEQSEESSPASQVAEHDEDSSSPFQIVGQSEKSSSLSQDDPDETKSGE